MSNNFTILFILENQKSSKVTERQDGGSSSKNNLDETFEDSENSTDEEVTQTQIGNGNVTSIENEDQFIKRIAFLVKKEIEPRTVGTLWNNFNLTSPSTSVIKPPPTEVPAAVHYDNTIPKSDFNDSFDEKRLLSFIPIKYKKNARELLKQFNSRGSELNWDTAGVIYINGNAIPNSDIFLLFPYLFRAKRPKKLNGFDDFVAQIIEMGLNNLLFKSVRNFAVTKKAKEIKPTTGITSPVLVDDSKDNWWFLG